MNINYKEITKIIKDSFMSDTQMRWRETVSVANDGFPGTFNLSLNEPELLEEYGQYLNYDHDVYFSKIQNIIRHNDLHIIEENLDTKHLTTFEMAGISYIDQDATKLEDNLKKVIAMYADIFFNKLKLDPKKLYVKVCRGGTVSELTNGRYTFNQKIEKDILTYNEWKEHGVPEKNFIWDETRDSFLSLFMFTRPTPWGYRNELLYDVGLGLDEEKLLDIGTVEYTKWKPIFDNENTQKKRFYMIKNIDEWEHYIVACGLGVERLLMASNGYKTVMECDHLAHVYQTVLEDAENKDEKAAYRFVDLLRTIQRIINDSEGYVYLSRKRQEKMGQFTRVFYEASQKLGIKITNDIGKYLDLLKSNLILNERVSNEYVVRDILRVLDRRITDLPIWPQAEFHSAEEGFEKVVDQIMEEKGREILGIVPASLLKIVPDAATRFREKRIKQRIKLKVIIDNQNKEILERHDHDSEEIRELRFANKLTQNLKTAMYIYGNRLAVLSAADGSEGGMIIENKEYAEMMRRLFMYIWSRTSK